MRFSPTAIFSYIYGVTTIKLLCEYMGHDSLNSYIYHPKR